MLIGREVKRSSITDRSLDFRQSTQGESLFPGVRVFLPGGPKLSDPVCPLSPLGKPSCWPIWWNAGGNGNRHTPMTKLCGSSWKPWPGSTYPTWPARKGSTMHQAPARVCSRCHKATRNRPAVCDDCRAKGRRSYDDRPSASKRGYDRRWRKYRLAACPIRQGRHDRKGLGSRKLEPSSDNGLLYPCLSQQHQTQQFRKRQLTHFFRPGCAG